MNKFILVIFVNSFPFFGLKYVWKETYAYGKREREREMRNEYDMVGWSAPKIKMENTWRQREGVEVEVEVHGFLSYGTKPIALQKNLFFGACSCCTRQLSCLSLSLQFMHLSIPYF